MQAWPSDGIEQSGANSFSGPLAAAGYEIDIFAVTDAGEAESKRRIEDSVRRPPWHPNV